MGVLAATGLIVGESLFGVVFAGIVAWVNRTSPVPPIDAPLAVVGESFLGVALWIAPLLFAGLIALLYARTRGLVGSAPPPPEAKPEIETPASFR
jgi:hypothetical protein